MAWADEIIKDKKKRDKELAQYSNGNNFNGGSSWADSVINDKLIRDQSVANTVNTLNSIGNIQPTIQPTIQPIDQDILNNINTQFTKASKKSQPILNQPQITDRETALKTAEEELINATKKVPRGVYTDEDLALERGLEKLSGNNPDKPSSFDDATTYLAKRFGNSALNSAIDQATSLYWDELAGGTNAKNKSTIQNVVEGTLKTIDPLVAGTILNIPEKAQQINRIINDPNKDTLGKIINTGIAALPSNPMQNVGIGAAQNKQALSNVTGLDIYDPAKEAKQVLDKVYDVTKYDERQQKIAQETEQMPTWLQHAGNITDTVGYMMPSAIINAVTGGGDIGTVMMGLGAKGRKTKEAIEAGADISTANDIGWLTGGIEAGTEYLSSGNKIFKSKGQTYALDNLINNTINKNIKNPVMNFILKRAAGDMTEVLEEVISDLAGTAIDRGTIDPNAKYTLKDLLQTTLYTIASTEAMNTGYDAINYVGTGKTSYQLNKEEMKQFESIKKATDKIYNQQDTSNMTNSQKAELRAEIENGVIETIESGVQDIISGSDDNAYYLGNTEITPNKELQEVEQQEIKDNIDALNLEENVEENLEENIEENTNEEINEEQQETTPATTELELNLENQTQNQTRNNIDVTTGLEDYIKNNNLTELTQENIDDYINQILEEQQANLTEQERKSLIDEYQDIIKDYAKDNGIPVIEAPKIEIPDMTAESKAPSKAIGRETRNEIKNQVNAFNNAVKSDQYKVGNQVKEQYKNLEQKSINKLDNDALFYNVQEQKKNTFTQKQGNYVYQPSSNPRIDAFRRSTATYFPNNGSTQAFARVAEKVIRDTGVTVRFNPNLKDSKGNIANGTYKDGTITINPNSNRAAEFLLTHELTHAIGNKQMLKMIETYRKSNPEFNSAVEKLLSTYNASEINEEALADISGQLFGNQEFIDNLAKEKPSKFKQLYNQIKYIWHQIRGYKNQNEFVEDLYNKWTAAYNKNIVKQNDNAKYYIENVASFNAKEYNNIKQKQLSDQEFANLSSIINSDVTVKPGINLIENVYDYKDNKYKDYEIYYKSKGQFKVIDSKESGDYNDAKFSTEEIGRGNETTRSRTLNDKVGSNVINNNETNSGNDGISNINKGTESTKGESNTNNRQNIKELGNSSFSNEPINLKNTKYSKDNEEWHKYFEKTFKDKPLTKADDGTTLTKEQKELFKDDKARNDKGELVTVYHTMTTKGPQFNEFNPVGTPGYRFGDQEVNYYTNDKEMSGSYADQEYSMADTKKITSMKEAEETLKNWVDDIAERDITDSNTEIKIEKKGKKYQIVNNVNKNAYEYAKSVWENEITPEEKQIEKDYNELYKKYVDSGYDNNAVPEFTSLDKYAPEYSKKLDKITDKMTPKEREALISFRKPDMKFNPDPIVISSYNNQEDLFRNIKQDIQKMDLNTQDKFQYKGYVNITNPYVIDAEGRYWNKVESKEDSRTTKDLISLDTLTKDRLIELAKSSKKRYEEVYNEYHKWNNAKNSIGFSALENSRDVRLANRIIDDVSLPAVKEFINNDYNYEKLEKKEKGLGDAHIWRTNRDIMWAMYNNDFIPYSDYQIYEKTGEVPDTARTKLKEIVNQKANYTEKELYGGDGSVLEKKQAKLIDIYDKYLKSYNAYDNNGRYDYSLFDNQLIEGYLQDELKEKFPIKDDFGDISYGNLQDLYKSALHDFNEDYIRQENNIWSVTNDIVKQILELNKYGANYDGIIMKNVIDYGGESKNHAPHDLYVTFKSNQFKAFDNLTPTEDADIRYSKDNSTWREYLEKEFPTQGTTTSFNDMLGKETKKTSNTTPEVKTPQNEASNKATEGNKNYLTQKEQQELQDLKDLENTGWVGLTTEEQTRMEELEKKSQGIVKKYPELKTNNKYEDIKDIYGKYKNSEISKENDKILKQAKDIVPANKQNRRTIDEWKQVAEYIGSNANIKSSQDLQKLAMETWFEQKPNNPSVLNRQGKKYVKFGVDDWVNSVYKGAGVGTEVKMSVEETTDSKGNKVELLPTSNNTYEQVNTPKPKKTDTIVDMTNKSAKVGDKQVSNFYSNITEKSKFITEENRESLKDNENLKYYDAITNKDTLLDAMGKLDANAEQQIGDFFAKDSFNAEDMATGWILIKRYQDAGNYEAMSNVIETMRDKGTKSGQAIQMLGMLNRLTPEGMEFYAQRQLDNAYNKFVENKSKKEIDKYAQDFTLTPEEHQFIKDTMEKVEKMTNEDDKKVEVAKIVKMLSDKLPPEKGSRVKAWMRISMLGNPKTQVRNVVGNAIIQPFNWLGDTVASRIDKIMSKKTGIRTKGNTDFGALAGGFVKGAKEAVRDAKLGIDTRDINLNRFEENIGAKPFYEGHKSKVLNAGAKVLNKTNQILGNVMSGGDRVFYQAIYDNSLKNQMKLNNVTTPTQEMMDIAEQEALSRTWNDSNEYTKAVLQIRNAMNKLNVKGYGLGDVLVPFAKTPANITKAIVDYSPIGLASSILIDGKKFKNSLDNGQYNAQLQHKFADSLGKGFAGTILWTAAYALAKAGITSGASDDDKDVANFMRNTLGIQPYSVKIGDKSFTYDWAQPIAAPFAIMADVENQKKKTKDAMDLLSYIKTAGNTGLNILLDQSFLSSIQDVFNNYDGPAAAIEQQIQDLPARATPTFFKQIADLIDPVQRQTYVKGNTGETVKNKVQVKIPGASKELTAQRDTLGREIKKYGGDDNIAQYAFNVFLNPANTNKGKPSAAAEEIYDVYKNTGDKTVMPRQVGYSENVGGTTIPLSAEERNEWQRLSGEKIEDSVKALTSNPKYNSMSYEDKADVINGIVNYSFAKAKSDMFGTQISTQYKTASKKEAEGIPIADYYVDRISKRK